MIKEYINECHLCGYVGNAFVRFGGMVEFTLCTQSARHDHNGNAIVECTWHTVHAFGGIEGIKSGVELDVIGRLKTLRYVDSAGNDRQAVVIIASKITRL